MSLSLSDQNAYRNCLKLFDSGQYKKGLKAAEQLLVKYPENGEFSCTKGLFLVYLNKLDQGLSCIKSGLMRNLNSSTNWHIYGIYYKVTKNYDEACKCYLKATKLDPNNTSMKRDLCYLLGYNRMYQQLVQHLQLLLISNPAMWVHLALAYFFTNQFKESLAIVDQHESSLFVNNTANREASNAILFKCKLYMLTNQPDIGITYINKHEQYCLDPISVLQLKAALYLQNKQFDQSLPLYKECLQFNSEEPLYVQGYLHAKTKNGSPAEISAALLAIKDEFSSYYIKFAIIDSLQGPLKAKELSLFMSKIFNRKSPGFWRLFKHIYIKEPTLYNTVISQLADSFDTSSHCYYFYIYSQYCQYLDLKEITKAKDAFNQLKSLPYFTKQTTSDKIDYLVAHAKILKHDNQFIEAAKLMEEAQLLDTGDRSLNVRCCKYYLRGKDIESAIQCVQLFLRKEPKKEMISELLAVQCIWLCWELLQYFQGTTVFIKLMKLVLGYFEEMRQDELDFQGFCGRKTIMTPFVGYTKWIDKGMTHAFIVKIGIYLINQLNSVVIFNTYTDKTVLMAIFGEKETDLDGSMLYSSQSFRKENILLQIADILSKLDDKNAKETAFKVYYQQGNL